MNTFTFYRSEPNSPVPACQVVRDVLDLTVDMELLADELALKDLAMAPYTIW